MHYKEAFCLFKRGLPSGRKVYYYVVWDALGRRRQFSTGEKSKALAHRVCLELYRKNQLVPVGPRLLEEFAENWFHYDQCPYIQAKLLRGFSYSRTNADHQRGYLDQYVLPKFGKMRMDSIKVAQVEDWLLELKRKGLSNNSVNHILAVFKILFNEADRLGYLLNNPAKAVRNLAENSRPKGFMEDDEVERLFDMATWEKTWSGQWMQYAFNLTACQTGMRFGEIQGLQKDCLFEDHIKVMRSWDRNHGIKNSTKTGGVRYIPIKPALHTILAVLAASSTKGPYLFSASEGTQPIDHKAVDKWYKRALEAIGIPKDQRLARRISMHSYRWYLNTKLRAQGVPDAIVRSLTGHAAGTGMTEHYTNLTLETVKKAIEKTNWI